MPVEPGQMLSHYRLAKKIGEGGMGVVWKARDEKLRRDVALKVLPAGLVEDPERRRRLLREARTAAAVNHPNIAMVFEVDEAEGTVFIAMELVEGKTLRSLLGGRPLAIPEALRIGTEMAQGLAAAHQAKVIHRDLKPENVLLRADGLVKILDFGLAKVHEEPQPAEVQPSQVETVTERMTKEGRIQGTPAYMSPEQARGEAVDARSDLFSFGSMLYEMITGKPPFPGKTPMDTLAAIINTPAIPASQMNREVSSGLEEVLSKCLAKDADRRYQSVSELVAALGELKDTAGPVMWSRRWPLVLAGGVALLLVVVLGIDAVRERGRGGPSHPDAAVPTVSKNVVAVFPFTVRGGDEIEYLAEGMVDILVPLLDGAGNLRSIDSLALLKAMEGEGDGKLDQERYQAIAERFGAGLYILGNILNVGGQVQIGGDLYASEIGAASIARATVRGDEQRIYALAEDLAAQLLAGMVPGPTGQQIRFFRQSTDSFPALKAFLQGENLARVGQFYEAHETYQRAVDLDPGFALAYYRDSLVVGFINSDRSEDELMQKAWELRDRLPAREQQTLEGRIAWFDGRPEEAIRMLRLAVEHHPDHIEARWLLALSLFHYGRRQNLWLEEAEQQLERVLADQPDHHLALNWLAWLAVLQQDYTKITYRATRALELDPDSHIAPAYRAHLAFRNGDVAAQEASLDELRGLDSISRHDAFYGVVVSGNLENASRLARLRTEPSRSPQEQAEGYVELAEVAVARGRWSEARGHLEAFEVIQPVRAKRSRATLASTPLLQLSEEELQAIQDDVAGLQGSPVLQAYLSGILSTRLGDTAVALRRAAELDSLYQASPSGQLGWPDWAEDLAHTLRAEVARLDGDVERALSEIAQVHPEQFYLDIHPDGVIKGEAYPRYLKGMLLADSRDHDAAIRWYGSLGLTGVSDIVYLAPKHLRLGELFEKLGDTTKAMHHYGRFVELWKDCDPELRPLVDAAAERLGQLKATTG